MPGTRRKRAGKGFTYVAPSGAIVRDPADLARIRSLAIPPAYRDVWICALANGHIQATGRDARGRKQYRYHPKWREIRDETKFTKMLAFSEVLPRIRARVERDLGLTTLKDQHVDITGSTLRFEFRGKSGKLYRVAISDRRIARIVQRCQSLPAEELFQYLDDDGKREAISSEDVNQYLREIAREDFTSKDFRTWVGTCLAVAALKAIGPCRSAKESKSNILRAIDTVSEQLNNTRAVCRKYYIHPAIFETYQAGTMLELLQNGTKDKVTAGLRSEEAALVRLLRHQLGTASQNAMCIAPAAV
jgi:DNA topoisomerase I